MADLKLCYVGHGAELCESPEHHTYYLSCWECGHIYGTREDLETLDYAIQLDLSRNWPDFTPEHRQARDIHVCPRCTHDF